MRFEREISNVIVALWLFVILVNDMRVDIIYEIPQLWTLDDFIAACW